MIEYRQITDKVDIYNHLAEFEEIFPHLHEKISDLHEYAEKLSKAANVVLGIKDQTVFGMIVFYANDCETRTAYISLIGIKKRFQGQGLGTCMLNECIEHAVKYNMKYLRLEVDLDNERAISFYSSKGFQREKQASSNSYYMVLQI